MWCDKKNQKIIFSSVVRGVIWCLSIFRFVVVDVVSFFELINRIDSWTFF